MEIVDQAEGGAGAMKTKPTATQLFNLLERYVAAVLMAERVPTKANWSARLEMDSALCDAIKAACNTTQLVVGVRVETIGLEEALDLLMPVVQEAVQQEFSNAADAMKFIEDGVETRRNDKM